jgi:hypothetical protein
MDDAYQLPDYVLESYRFMRAPWRTERVDGTSHFMMLDRPEQSRPTKRRPLGWCCNRLIADATVDASSAPCDCWTLFRSAQTVAPRCSVPT